MDTPNDRLNKFITATGAGMDSAGRPVYGGPHHMYASPKEFSQTQATHNQLKADAVASDPQGNMIRELLDRIARESNAGTANVGGLMGSFGAPSYKVQAKD